MTNGSLKKVESIAKCLLGAFCNTFDLHSAIIGLKNQFSVSLRVAVLHRFYCGWKSKAGSATSDSIAPYCEGRTSVIQVTAHVL